MRQRKRLKTASSDRVVPGHPELLDLLLIDFVANRRRAGEAKLFSKVGIGGGGLSVRDNFAWFARFLLRRGRVRADLAPIVFVMVAARRKRRDFAPRTWGLVSSGWLRVGVESLRQRVQDQGPF